MKWGSLFLVLMLFLAACNSTIQAEEGPVKIPKQEKAPQAKDPCEGIECPEGKVCKQGKCTCETGKACGEDCIPQDACCTDADCEGKCTDNECAVPCSHGEVFKEGECKCAEGFKFCEQQDKCIPRDACCTLFNCGSFEECVKTSYGASVCLKKEQKTKCRMLTDIGRVEFVDIGEQEFRMMPEQFRDEELVLKINNSTIILQPEVHTEKEGVEIWQEGIEILGGFCREEDED